MSSETTLIILGVAVFVSPFIGLPLSILSWILPLLALGIIGFSYHLRTKSMPVQKSPAIPSAEHSGPGRHIAERQPLTRTRTEMS